MRLMLLRRNDTTAPLVARAMGVVLRLADEAAEPANAEGEAKPEIPKRKWIHVATEGSYAGHGDGEFTLDAAVFKAFVDRLHADPQFKAGDDGIGTQPVVPFDYEHVSEMDPREGSVPSTGAPAPAWVLDLKVEEIDGKANLFAYAELGETIRQQMAANEYRFVSIAFALETADPVSGEAAGPKLTSIAFTNHPFLRDLAPVAASSKRRLRYYYGDAATSPDQAFEYTRSILGLPAAYTLEQVLTELAKIVGWSEDLTTAPAGVDIAEIMKNLRCAWAIPVTSTNAELLANAKTAAANMAKPAQEQTPAPTPAPAPAAAPAAAATETTESTTMTMSKSLFDKLKPVLLAGRGGAAVRMLDDEEAVVEEVKDALAAKTNLADLLKSLGYDSAQAALAGIPELKAAKGALTDALAQLDEALAMSEQVEAASETSDIDAAMSAKGYAQTDESLRTSLTVHRNSLMASECAKAQAAQPKDETGAPKRLGPKALAEARKAGRKAFFAAFGIAPDRQEHLLRNIVAAPGGKQLAAPSLDQQRELALTPPNGNGNGLIINLSAFEGVNDFERLCAYVRTEKGMDKAGHAQVVSRASKLRADKTVTITR